MNYLVIHLIKFLIGNWVLKQVKILLPRDCITDKDEKRVSLRDFRPVWPYDWCSHRREWWEFHFRVIWWVVRHGL